MKKKFFRVFLISILIFSTVKPAQADLENQLKNQQNRLDDIQSKQDELKAAIEEAKKEERTLSNQLSYLDNQIQLTELEIQETQQEIFSKQEEVDSLVYEIVTVTKKLERVKEAIQKLTAAFQARIRASYKTSQVVKPGVRLPILISGVDDISDLMMRYKYLKVIEAHDQKILEQLEATRGNYNLQKENLETKKKEIEELRDELSQEKARLEAESAVLEQQKASKAYLLQITKNDEATYQRMLNEYEAEQASIQSAISNLISQIVDGGAAEGEGVERGQIIGIQGHSGLATGDHLHFGVYVKCGDYWCHTNPKPYLDSGELAWPMQPHVISQWYGVTEFALASGFYPDNFHNGIDMYYDVGSPILAAESGTVHYTVDQWGGKGALIYHSDNLMTLYWHLQ